MGVSLASVNGGVPSVRMNRWFVISSLILFWSPSLFKRWGRTVVEG